MTSLEKLPVDVWDLVLDLSELNDYSNLLCTCRNIRAVLQHDRNYERYARRKFPHYTLGLESYHGSYKALLQDGNAENGVYVRSMNVVSRWRYNCDQMFYTNAVRFMVWDRKNHTISVIVEGFGHSDLREANTTAIFMAIGTRLGMGSWSRMTVDAFRPEIQGWWPRYHDICELVFQETKFQVDCSYRFTYNGSDTESGSDYECKLFLSRNDFSSIPNLFGVHLPLGREEFKDSSCQFFSRWKMADLMKPSNVLEWPINLPGPIREMHRQGHWGNTNMNALPGPIREMHRQGHF